MAATFKLFTDAALTQPFVPGVDFIGPVISVPSDFVLYLGSQTSANKLEAASDPGIDDIIVSIVDAAPASDLEATDVKLATTNAGLAAAVGGDPLNLGTVINGGVGNEAEIIFGLTTQVGSLQIRMWESRRIRWLNR